MMRRCYFASLVLALSLFLVAVSQGQPGLSDEDTAQLIAHETKNIQDLLAKKPDPKRINRARAAALMIAYYAQEAGMADTRGAALDILKTVEKDPAGAKKLAAALKAGKGGNKIAGMELHKHLDLESVMKMFSTERAGGFALEQTIDDLIGINGPLNTADKAKAQILTNKIASIAFLTQHYAPEKDDGAKSKKAWGEFSKETQKAAMALSAAVRKNEGIGSAAMGLSTNCKNCHEVFR